MRRIAAGLPLAIPLLAAPFNVGGCYPLGYTCPSMPNPVVVEYVAEDAGPGDAGPLDCVSICGSDVHCEAVDESHVECVHLVQDCPGAGRLPDAPTYAAPTHAAPTHAALSHGALSHGALSHAAPTHAARDRADDSVVAWLTQAAALEAASVVAFDRLAQQLSSFGAPDALVSGARRSADDERRHAAVMGALVAARGGPARIEVRIGPAAASDLRSMAVHNAKEGCVREAFGALEAAAQSARASDADVRNAFASIAPDEGRHALLSFAIDDWARAKLGDGAMLDSARLDARRELAGYLDARARPAGLGLLAADEARTALG